MAASLLLPSPSYSNRIGQEELYIYSNYWQKGIIHFSVCLQHQKCNIKLYSKPRRTVTHFRTLRCFNTNGSVELCGASRGGLVSSDVSAPNSLQRSKTLLDCSSNPVDGMNDFERQLQELFVEVKTMIKMGNKDGAIDLLQANYEAVKEQIDAGAKGMEQAAILDIVALGYMAIGDFDFVEFLLDMCSEELEIMKLEQEWNCGSGFPKSAPYIDLELPAAKLES